MLTAPWPISVCEGCQFGHGRVVEGGGMGYPVQFPCADVEDFDLGVRAAHADERISGRGVLGPGETVETSV